MASKPPSMPIATAVSTSWEQLWPASVAWLHSTFSLKSFSSPNSRRNPAVVPTSQSYWCLLGSCGLGSINNGRPFCPKSFTQ